MSSRCPDVMPSRNNVSRCPCLARLPDEALRWNPSLELCESPSLNPLDRPPGAKWVHTKLHQGILYCPTCVQTCNSMQQWTQHRTARRHQVHSAAALAWRNRVGWRPDETSETSPGSGSYLTWILRYDDTWPVEAEMWFQDDPHHKVWDPHSQGWKGGTLPQPDYLRNILASIRYWLEEDSSQPWAPFHVQTRNSATSEIWVRCTFDGKKTSLSGRGKHWQFRPQTQPPPAWITMEEWVALRQHVRGRLPGDPQPFRQHVLQWRRSRAMFFCRPCRAFANSVRQWVAHRNGNAHRKTVLQKLYLDHLKEALMLSGRGKAARLMPATHEEWPRVLLDSVPHRPELNILKIVIDPKGCEVIDGDGDPSAAPDLDEQKAILDDLEWSLPRCCRGQRREDRILFPAADETGGADVPDVSDEYDRQLADYNNYLDNQARRNSPGPDHPDFADVGKSATADVPDVQTHYNHSYDCYDCYDDPNLGAGSSYPFTLHAWPHGPGTSSTISM